MNESFSKIIDKISEALNFFDFSFIVSGGLTFSVIFVTIDFLNIPLLLLNSISTPVKIIACIGAIYICGLISFAGGKSIRLYFLYKLDSKRGFSPIFIEALKFIKKYDETTATEVDGFIHKDSDTLKLYYTRMWMELRHCANAEATIKLLNRFWVMQAVFEGLYFSFILALICSTVLMLIVNHSFMIGIVIAFFCIWFCYKEAQRYAETQINEIVIAYKKFILNGNREQ